MLRTVVIFDDVGQNRHKKARSRALTDKLLSRVEAESHPGVFIVRGGSGARRLMLNEMEVAEHLRETRGFRIVDPMKTDLSLIAEVCAGARVVVGVEGSHLIHGILLLRPGAALLTLQPPTRFCSLFKHLTDRDDQHFGFVVGTPKDDGFFVDVEEVERTLDLFPDVSELRCDRSQP